MNYELRITKWRIVFELFYGSSKILRLYLNMKKLLCLLLLCPLFLTAQEDKYSVGVFASPQLYGISQFSSQMFYKSGRFEPKVGLSAGVNTGVKLSEKVTLRSGLGYSLVRYQYIKKLRLDDDIQNGTTSDYIENYNYHDIHLPILFQYGNKFFGTIGTEISYQFGIENTERIIYEGNGNVIVFPELQAEGMANVAIQLGMGYTVQLDDKLNLLLEPLIKYYLKPYVMLNSYLHCLSLKTTINYRL